MNLGPLVEIYCDGNNETGYGHIRRSASLAFHLKKNNIPVRIAGLSERAEAMVPKIADFEGPANIAVFDSPYPIDKKIEDARNNRLSTITFDWFGSYVPDINIVVFPHKEVRAIQRSFIGFEYIIIRDDITSIQASNGGKLMKNVVVCLGGGDLLDQGYQTASLLSNKGYNVTLIQGPLAKRKNSNDNFMIFVNPPEYADIISKCDWVVTNGGACFFEAMYLGKAAFVLPQTELEKIIAQYAEKNGALLGYGINNLYDFQFSNVEEVITKAMKLVDGHGLDRITTIIKNLA